LQTSYAAKPSNYEFIQELRKSKKASLKPCEYLKDTFKLRPYQAIGALHFLLLNRMILGDGAGLGKCVSADTRIPTSKGFIKIKDILPGTSFERDTFYPVSNLNVITTNGVESADSLYYSGFNKGLEIKTDKGYSIKVLNHHPLYVFKDGRYTFKRADKLSAGDTVCISREGIFPKDLVKLGSLSEKPRKKKQVVYPRVLDENLAEVVGFLVSDVCPQFIKNTGWDKEINYRIKKIFRAVFNVDIFSVSVRVWDILKDSGIAISQKSKDKIIPEQIFRSPKKVIRSFLRGYFEGEGDIDRLGNISCPSRSKQVVEDIQKILLMFGVVSSVTAYKRRKEKYALSVSGKDVEVFSLNIGFISKSKRAKLSRRRARDPKLSKDFVPNGAALIRKAQVELFEHLKSLPDKDSKKLGWQDIVGVKLKKYLEDILRGKRKVTYEKLTKFVNKLSELGLLYKIHSASVLVDILSKNVYFDTVNSIKECESEFFDLALGTTHNFVGNGFINHNTAQAIAGYCYSRQKYPALKLLVATPKSAVDQWCEEIEKFTNGITFHALMNEYGRVKATGELGDWQVLKGRNRKGAVEKLTGFEARKAQYDSVEADILVCGYFPIQQDYTFLVQNRGPEFMVIFDEIQELKNRKGMKHLGADKISEAALKVYGLSATVIKNRLEEAYNIYRVVVPGLFGGPPKFEKNFMKFKQVPRFIKGKKRFVKAVSGYKNLDEFRDLIAPYFLIRKTREVADELPRLISKKVVLEMTTEQERLYKQALNGDIYRKEVKRKLFEHEEYLKGVTDPSDRDCEKLSFYKKKYDESLTAQGLANSKMAALSYCQLISNGPAWMREEGESSKEMEFKRLFEQELFTEKVIVFTRFKSGISRLEAILDELKIKHRKVTGDVSGADRKKARLEFSDTSNDINVIFITQAGSAAINLQAANVILFYDTPWSYGDLYQTIGRAQRIGSVYEHVHLIHMVNKGTIDEHVLKVLFSKKDLITEIMGDIAEGSLEFTKKDELIFKDEESTIDALFDTVFKK
jgi:intein/homing endonuclease